MGIAPTDLAGMFSQSTWDSLAASQSDTSEGGDALDVAQLTAGVGSDVPTPVSQLGDFTAGDAQASQSVGSGFGTLPGTLSTFAGAFGAGGITSGFSALIGDLTSRFESLAQDFNAAMQALTAQFTSPQPQPQPQPQPRALEGAAAGQATATVNPYDGLIRAAAQRHDLDPALLTAVARRESNFDPTAVSKAGAQGLMQLMPDTAKSLGVTNAFDPTQSVEGGAKLLRGLIDQFGGHLDLALAAYNAGPGAVQKYGGVPPYQETQAYVRDILADYRAKALTG
jgi:Transglycosylase SLT domain